MHSLLRNVTTEFKERSPQLGGRQLGGESVHYYCNNY